MSDYQKNIEVMAHSLALMLAPIVVLEEDDCFILSDLTEAQDKEVIAKMQAEYLNEVSVAPCDVRRYGLQFTYEAALAVEFDNSISYSCEQWIRRIQKDDRNA